MEDKLECGKKREQDSAVWPEDTVTDISVIFTEKEQVWLSSDNL